jgi:hypothetical protein
LARVPAFLSKVALLIPDSWIMELSPELFADIAGNPATGEQLKGEKRGAIRVPLGRRSAIVRERGRLTAVIREISVTGASLVVSRDVPVGERLVLCVPILRGSDLQVKCSVLRCERGVGGQVFIVGLKFEELLRSDGAAPPRAPTAAGKATEVTRIKRAMLGA